MTPEQIKKLSSIDKVIIHSFEGSLYLVSMIVAGEEHYISNKNGEPIKGRNKAELLKLFDPSKVKKAVLRQQSVYDEMIGNDAGKTDNTLEVALSFNDIQE